MSENLFERLNEFKERIHTKKAYDFETQLMKNDSFTYLSDDKLLYAHTLTHFFYSQRFPLKNRDWTRERICQVHNILTIEMGVRNIRHHTVDKLDSLMGVNIKNE